MLAADEVRAILCSRETHSRTIGHSTDASGQHSIARQPVHHKLASSITMLRSTQAALARTILILLFGISSLHRGEGIEDPGDCTILLCCEEDCCGPDTSWDSSTEYCVPDPGAPGFVGIYSPDFVAICDHSELSSTNNADRHTGCSDIFADCGTKQQPAGS